MRRRNERTVTRLEIVVDDRRLDLVEVLESRDRLNDDRPCLLLCQKLVLLQIEVKVVTLTVAQHCTEPVTYRHHYDHHKWICQHTGQEICQLISQVSNTVFLVVQNQCEGCGM